MLANSHITRGKSVGQDTVCRKNGFHVFYELVPELGRVLIWSWKLEIVGETARSVFIDIFEYVDRDFPAFLRRRAFWKVVSLHSGPAPHGYKEPSNQIPSLLNPQTINREMQLPIWSKMSKLILNMPINPAILSIKLNKAIITNSLITLRLTYLISILLKKLISKLLRQS